ncbi:hypothetical protein JXA32_15965 [Candidatus Sumerlaeota bacterium]|nr:hypothetical protein [Candidatus Sumerlaeota bacterium]
MRAKPRFLLQRALLASVLLLPMMAGDAAAAASDLPVQRGLVLYLSAGDIDGQSNGELGDPAQVQNWVDQSGKGNRAYIADPLWAPQKAPNKIGGNHLPAVVFDGYDDWLRLNDPVANVRTAIMVLYEDADAVSPQTLAPVLACSQRMVLHRGLKSSHFIGLSNSNPKPSVRVNGVPVDETITPLTPEASIITITYPQGSVEVDQLFKDRNFSDRVLKGGVGEYILYNELLAETEIGILETYLAAKYGVSQSGGGKYIKIELTNAGFEEPGRGKIASGFDSSPDVPGWSSWPYRDSGVETGSQRSGRWNAYLFCEEQGSCQQATSHQIHPNEAYRLSFWARKAPHLKAQLIGWTNNHEVVLAEKIVTHNSYEYANFQLDCNVEASSPAAEMWLGIRFTNVYAGPDEGGNSWAQIDDVDLGYTAQAITAEPQIIQMTQMTRSDVHWLSSFDDAMNQAYYEDKRILAVFIRMNDRRSEELNAQVLSSMDFQRRSAGYVLAKLNVDECKYLADLYHITNYPEVIVFDSLGNMIHRISGVNPSRPDEQLYPLLDNARQ